MIECCGSGLGYQRSSGVEWKCDGCESSDLSQRSRGPAVAAMVRRMEWVVELVAESQAKGRKGGAGGVTGAARWCRMGCLTCRRGEERVARVEDGWN